VGRRLEHRDLALEAMQHAQLTLLLQQHCMIKHMTPVKHFTASDDSNVPDSGQQQATSNSFATALQQLCSSSATYNSCCCCCIAGFSRGTPNHCQLFILRNILCSSNSSSIGICNKHASAAVAAAAAYHHMCDCVPVHVALFIHLCGGQSIEVLLLKLKHLHYVIQQHPLVETSTRSRCKQNNTTWLA